MDATKIVGANGKRHANDFYPTPKECTIALLKTGLIQYGSKVWEPACGEGHIVKVMEKYGHPCHGTDIQTGVDFLTAKLSFGTDWIVTNPPFALADKFIRKCAEFQLPFALLLKSQYWHSARRKPLFDAITPSYILPLTWRPDFTGQGNSLMDMMWCVWLPEAYLNGNVETQYYPLEKPKGDLHGQTSY